MANLLLRYTPRLLLLLLIPLYPLFATSDYVVEEEADFFITPGDSADTYNITSKHKVLTRYLSKQSLSQRTFKVGESFFSPIHHLRPYLNDVHDNRIKMTYDFEQQRDILTSDYKLHTITYPAMLQIGDVAGYNYERNYKGIEYFPLLTVHNADSLASYTVNIHHPGNIRIEFDVWFPRQTLPFEVDRSDSRTTVLTFSNLGEVEPLHDFSFNYMHAFIQVIPYRQEKALVPVTPVAFAAWYRSLFDQDPIVESSALERLRSTLAPLPDNRSRLAALHDYVRKNIRYIAEEHNMGAIVPRDPSAVLTRNFGDCKDRGYLIYSLARAFGIGNVHMALIHTEARPALKGCHMWQFNHMICALEEDGKVLFFDPTDTYTPFGEVPDRLVERPAFVLNPDNPRYVVVARANSAPIVEVAITASVQNPDKARARIRVRGRVLSRAQWLLDNYTSARVNTELSQYISEHFHSIALGNLTLAMRSDTAIEFNADADLSYFLVPSKARVFIPSTPFPRVPNDLVDRADDSLKVSIYNCDNIALAITLAAPGYRAEPASVSLGEGTPGVFTATVSQTGDNVELRYRFIEKQRELHGNDKRAHMKFCADYLQQKRNVFTLTGATP